MCAPSLNAGMTTETASSVGSSVTSKISSITWLAVVRADESTNLEAVLHPCRPGYPRLQAAMANRHERIEQRGEPTWPRVLHADRAADSVILGIGKVRTRDRARKRRRDLDRGRNLRLVVAELVLPDRIHRQCDRRGQKLIEA